MGTETKGSDKFGRRVVKTCIVGLSDVQSDVAPRLQGMVCLQVKLNLSQVDSSVILFTSEAEDIDQFSSSFSSSLPTAALRMSYESTMLISPRSPFVLYTHLRLRFSALCYIDRVHEPCIWWVSSRETQCSRLPMFCFHFVFTRNPYPDAFAAGKPL